MRVKVGNNWYEVEIGQPIMLELTEKDKYLISNLPLEVNRYALFAEDDEEFPTDQHRTSWMMDGAKDPGPSAQILDDEEE